LGIDKLILLKYIFWMNMSPQTIATVDQIIQRELFPALITDLGLRGLLWTDWTAWKVMPDVSGGLRVTVSGTHLSTRQFYQRVVLIHPVMLLSSRPLDLISQVEVALQQAVEKIVASVHSGPCANNFCEACYK
jgi:hypothetical protein